MRSDIRLSAEDVQIKQENALELFYSGIKSKATKEPMTRNLKKFLVDACADLLKGNFEQRAQQFVDLARANQEKATYIILAYIKRLKARTMLDKSDQLYLNPSTIPNKIKPIKKLVEMSGLGLPWKRVYSTYPELNNTHQGRGYTREEIQKLLEYSDGVGTDFILLALSSGGLRVGAWENQTWENIFPIYKVRDEYKVELENNESGKIVCAGMFVYKSTPDQYVALISIEAWNKLQEYKKVWTKKMKRAPIDSNPLILERFSKPTPLNTTTVKRRIEHLLQKSGLRIPLTEGQRRHHVPETHGFRRYWDKVMMTTQRKRGNVEFINGDYIKHKTFNRVVKSNIIFCINEEPLSTYVMIEKTLKPNSFFITFGFPHYPIIPQSRLRNYYIMKTPFKIARNEHIWVRSVVTRNSKIEDVYRKMRRDFKPKFAKDDIEDLRELIISIKWLFEKLKCS